jgi:hypothetical protein
MQLDAIQANPDDEAEAKVRRNHGAMLMAGLPGYTIGWHHGHARSLHITEPFGTEPSPGDVVADFLQRPVARFLRHIHVGSSTVPASHEYTHCVARITDAIAAAPRPALRSLVIGAREIPETFALDEEGREALAAGDLGNLERLWPAVPHLERLLLSGGRLELGTLVLPELRDFELRQSSLGRPNLESLAVAHMPKLERLSLWCGAHDDHLPEAIHDYSPADLGRVLDQFPALWSVGFVSTMDTLAIAEMVLASDRTLIELDLGGGVLQDAELARLMRHRARLARFGSLDLRWNLLSSRARDITSGLRNVRLEPQRHARSYLQPRFNACQE